ncbi:MAG TPA: UDP-N-acetylmuramoyl-L-alanine--D-glutamate ligase [Steroidobacteraceae bacterium]|jgi:UDP-N-acetylmuramoylalanine--D-glutamate ligase|nr:UDP-N-acetylmuramoyl-L-alanine--D-glutamate ligase [Steroidobacteraceae bacterium]
MNANHNQAAAAVIVGLGRTGFSCARYLAKRGWRVAVTDTRDAPPELARLRALDPGIDVRLGGLDPQLLEHALCVVVSPGVSLAEPFFMEARRRGLEIVGDIELFARAADAPVVGITGTNGKSTVTTLLGRMAHRAALRVRVGGNLGEPALDLLDADDSSVRAARAPDANVSSGAAELYVLELSSFQLETTHSLDLVAAAVLNVSADHLDRYASLEAYAAAKARIFARCDTAVINLDDPLVATMPRPGQRTLSFSLRATIGADYALAAAADDWWLMRRGVPLLRLAEMKLGGGHNAANALAALALGEALDLPLAAMLAELRGFAGLPHRSQWVARVRGVTYINDSKGTNVGATLAAVGGMHAPVVLIAGGEGKNQDFTPLAAALRGKLRHAVLIGRAAAEIARVLEAVCTVERCATLEEAVRAAARAAQPDDAVLLSPACASVDMFTDYAQRGAVFEQAVRELAA